MVPMLMYVLQVVRRVDRDYALTLRMALALAGLLVFYAVFFGSFVLLGLPARGVVLAALIIVSLQVYCAQRVLLHSFGLERWSPDPPVVVVPLVRKVGWWLAPALLPWIIDAMWGFKTDWHEPVIWSVVLLTISTLFVAARWIVRRRRPSARTAAKLETPDPDLTEILDRVVQHAGCARPRLLVLSEPVPNAMALGLSPRRGLIIVTRGLIELGLTRQEQEAVLAHELGHLLHHDTPVLLLAGALGMLLSSTSSRVAQFLDRPTSGGGGGGGGGGSGDLGQGAGLVVAFLMLVAVVIAVLGVSTWLIDFALTRALSRYRELAADRASAVITADPSQLASALTKLRGAINGIPEADLRRLQAASALMLCPDHHTPVPGQVAPSRRPEWRECRELALGLAGFSIGMAGLAGLCYLWHSGWQYPFYVVAGGSVLGAVGLGLYSAASYGWHRLRPDLELRDEIRILMSTHPTVERRVSRLLEMVPR